MTDISSGSESLKRKTAFATIWGALERFSAQGISFVVMIIMARILTPADYGLVGMVLIFIHVAQSLVDSGFSQALIRKQDREEIDDSTAFYFNIAVGLGLYILIWFLAPLIARFYDEPRLIWITRVICLGILFNSLAVVQRALLTVDIDFKTQAKASIISALAGGGAGISMAYTGFGVWSIVAYHVVNLGLNCGMLWVYSKWRPKRMFSWSSFRYLFGFGSKMAAAGLLHTLYQNAYIMVIGKVFKASELGLYTRATQFVSFLSSNFSGIIQKVTYPVLCRFQDDDERLGEVFLRLVRVSAFVSFALIMGMGAIAKPMIYILLGDKWMFSATLLSILCVAYMWYIVYSLNLNVLVVKGRSDLYLRLEIIKKIIFIGVLCATIPFGLVAMCWGQVVNALVETFVNSYYTGKFINVSIWKQLRCLLPSLFYSFSMAAIVWIIVWLLPNAWLQLAVGICGGALYFFLIAKLTRSYELMELIKIVKNLKK